MENFNNQTETIPIKNKNILRNVLFSIGSFVISILIFLSSLLTCYGDGSNGLCAVTYFLSLLFPIITLSFLIKLILSFFNNRYDHYVKIINLLIILISIILLIDSVSIRFFARFTNVFIVEIWKFIIELIRSVHGIWF